MPDVACPLILNLGPNVEYQLISRVLFIPAQDTDKIGHYITKTRIKDRTYLYNDLQRGGKLTELGPLYLLEEHDPNTSFVLYLRTSKASKTSRTVTEIQADSDKIPVLSKTPIPVEDNSDDEIDKMLIDSITSPAEQESDARFYTPEFSPPPTPLTEGVQMKLERSSAETDSMTSCPVWCSGCNFKAPDGDDDPNEVQCEECRYWSHINCLNPDVDYHAEDVDFICGRCLTRDPLVDTQVVYQSVFEVILTNLIRLEPGEITMIPDPNAPQWNARGVLWYSARFVRRHESRAGEDGEYEFEWLECMKGIIYHSSSSATLPSNLRTFCKGRKFCQAIHEFNDNLQSKQIGKVRLPFYMEPDHSSHKDPELEQIFHAALPHVAKILATFPDDHPLLNTIEALANGCAHLVWFQHLSLRPSLSLHCKVWLAICIWCTFQNQNYSEGYWVLGLLFFMAVQRELGEALNLNGDVLQDLLTGRIVPRPFDGPEALLVMFKACMIADGSSVSATTRMLKFNEAHVIYDQDYSETTFRRLAPSIFQPSAAIPAVLKRNGDENIVNEKPAKRTKTTKTQQAK
ncbi:hypothetical protein GGX14DRAFT_660762 [Mycena pura]|uniref:Zinc finger PHD-type domain-containing protein n=1 Tax=Mycena pura TaxID=153505 RepID=A0AAD6V5E6_9AGAR|nr:hypothetical protein GGX14DRAFT_660762 [Mycena pura]